MLLHLQLHRPKSPSLLRVVMRLLLPAIGSLPDRMSHVIEMPTMTPRDPLTASEADLGLLVAIGTLVTLPVAVVMTAVTTTGVILPLVAAATVV